MHICMHMHVTVGASLQVWAPPTPFPQAYQIQAEQIKARRSGCFHIRGAALLCGLISFMHTVKCRSARAHTHTPTWKTRGPAGSVLAQTKMCIMLVHLNALSTTQIRELPYLWFTCWIWTFLRLLTWTDTHISQISHFRHKTLSPLLYSAAVTSCRLSFSWLAFSQRCWHTALHTS